MNWREINENLQVLLAERSKLETQVIASTRQITDLQLKTGCGHNQAHHYIIANETQTRGCYACDRESLEFLRRSFQNAIGHRDYAMRHAEAVLRYALRAPNVDYRDAMERALVILEIPGPAVMEQRPNNNAECAWCGHTALVHDWPQGNCHFYFDETFNKTGRERCNCKSFKP